MHEIPATGDKRSPTEVARPLTRRAALKRAAAIVGGSAVGVLLAACGGSASPTTAPPTAAPTTGVAGSTTAGATATRAAGTATSSTAAASSVAGTRAAGSATTGTTAASGSSAAATAPAAAVTGQDATPKIVAAANAFLATLDSTQKASVQFDWSNTAQKQRWSNFPEGLFTRAGLMWGNLGDTQRNAWLALMQATLSAEGYSRVNAEWSADDALAAQEGSGGGAAPTGGTAGSPQARGTGGPPQGGANMTPPAGGTGGGPGQLLYGKQYYWIALIGTPSATSPWQWQWGGHHVTVNATIVGSNVSFTPSFIGVQPATYTNASGQTVRPLGDIEDEAFALVGSLDATQQKAAILGTTAIDLVLGPGQDGKTIQPEGLPASQMNATQQAALLKLIGHYANLGYNGTARMAEIRSGLSQTYLAWYGPTAKGSAAYFRVTGPTVVIEYSPQQMGGNAAQHIHGIYRDPTNDYGAKYTK